MTVRTSNIFSNIYYIIHTLKLMQTVLVYKETWTLFHEPLVEGMGPFCKTESEVNHADRRQQAGTIRMGR